MKINLLLLVTLLQVSGCKEVSSSQISNLCLQLNNQAMDSLALFNTSTLKDSILLSHSLSLIEEAIDCDSTFVNAKFNRITILSQLKKFDTALMDIDELIYETKDSSLYLIKGTICSQIGNREEELQSYNTAYIYYSRIEILEPENPNIIYGKLFSRFKIYGRDSIAQEILNYKDKYPNNLQIKMLLESIQ